MTPREAFSPWREKPLILWVLEAEDLLVRAWGGHDVTEEFFDNDRHACLRGGAYINPYYDFIHGEPYSKWY